MKLCILLTGTITPHNVPNLKRVDALQRENDYFEAIKHYSQFGIPIIFCENSGTNSEKINNIFNDLKFPSEYLTYTSNVSIEGKGKGEAELISHAFTNSNIIQKSTNIIKITGRYRVGNFLKQIKSVQENITYINLTRNLSYSDSRFFIMTPKFYFEYLSKNLHKVNEDKSIYIEHILLSSTLEYLADYNTWSLLNEPSRYIGYYGTENIKYNNNVFKFTLKRIVFWFKKELFKQTI